MAKCVQCRSCLRLIRVDFDNEAMIVWYCGLCDCMYEFKNNTKKLENNDLKILVKGKYLELYGNTLQ